MAASVSIPKAGRHPLVSETSAYLLPFACRTSVAPHPEDDNDPFSLGDDDEDKDKGDDLRKEDSERLKESARNSISAGDRKSTRLNSSHSGESRMPSSA